MDRKIAIIPDIHGRKFWEEITKKVENFDKIIFLGDYLDPYPQEEITEKEAFKNFIKILGFAGIYKDKVTLLLGNHDLHYYKLGCGEASRFNMWKSKEYHEWFINSKNLFKLAWSEKIDNTTYLFTHAGVTKGWLRQNNLNLDLDNIAEELCKLDLNLYGQVGSARWGYHDFGSPLWADYKHELIISDILRDDIYQIVGHTQQKEKPIINNHSACIDCRKIFTLEEIIKERI